VFQLLVWTRLNCAVLHSSLNSRHVLNKWHLIINFSVDVKLDPEGGSVLGTAGCRKEDNIKMYLKGGVRFWTTCGLEREPVVGFCQYCT
jgi:hypothetical protein